MKSYTLRDVVRVSEATEPTVKGWLRLGVLTPDVQSAAGRGVHGRFSWMNLVEARIVGRLHRGWALPAGALQRVVLTMRKAVVLLAKERPSTFELWLQILNPTLREPGDRIYVLISPDLPGGVFLKITTGGDRKPANLPANLTVQTPELLIVDVRAAIEEVEGLTGDSHVSAEAAPPLVARQPPKRAGRTKGRKSTR